MSAEIAILQNQISIMKVLFELTKEDLAKKELFERITFTQQLIKNLS